MWPIEEHRYPRAWLGICLTRAATVLNSGRELLVTHEIGEVYPNRIGDRQRAISALARSADRLPDDLASACAAEQIVTSRDEREPKSMASHEEPDPRQGSTHHRAGPIRH